MACLGAGRRGANGATAAGLGQEGRAARRRQGPLPPLPAGCSFRRRKGGKRGTTGTDVEGAEALDVDLMQLLGVTCRPEK